MSVIGVPSPRNAALEDIGLFVFSHVLLCIGRSLSYTACVLCAYMGVGCCVSAECEWGMRRAMGVPVCLCVALRPNACLQASGRLIKPV